MPRRRRARPFPTELRGIITLRTPDGRLLYAETVPVREVAPGQWTNTKGIATPAFLAAETVSTALTPLQLLRRLP